MNRFEKFINPIFSRFLVIITGNVLYRYYISSQFYYYFLIDLSFPFKLAITSGSSGEPKQTKQY